MGSVFITIVTVRLQEKDIWAVHSDPSMRKGKEERNNPSCLERLGGVQLQIFMWKSVCAWFKYGTRYIYGSSVLNIPSFTLYYHCTIISFIFTINTHIDPLHPRLFALFLFLSLLSFFTLCGYTHTLILIQFPLFLFFISVLATYTHTSPVQIMPNVGRPAKFNSATGNKCCNNGISLYDFHTVEPCTLGCVISLGLVHEAT